jgi:hypothetical protein
VLPLGALGAVTGAIVIGTVATLRSTTIIITIRTTISIAMSAARDKVIGSTIRNTAEMLPTATGKRRINSEVKVLVAQAALVIARVASGEPVAQEALVGLAAQVAQEALAELVVQVAQEALAELVVRVAPAGSELETVPAVVEQEPAPVAAAQELAPVVAEQVPGHLRAQLGAPERTKSVTGAHRRDQVPLLAAEEDLAAAAAVTTRDPVAAEAVIAWEVADIAVVVAEDAAAEE